MLKSTEINLNGSIITTKDGILHVNDNPVGVSGKDNSGFATKRELEKKSREISKKFICKDERGFLRKDDIEKIKQSIYDDIYQKCINEIEIIAERLKRDLKNNNETSIKVDAIIEAFNGKPQKLDKIRAGG